MKLHSLLLTSALLFISSFAFAKPQVQVSSHSDFTSMANTESTSKLTYTVFRMNGDEDEEEDGWEYAVIGYTYEKDEDGNIISTTPRTLFKLKPEDEGWITNDRQVESAVKGLKLPEDVEAGLLKHAEAFYKLSVEVPATIDEIGLGGGAGEGNTAISITNQAANNGNQFYSIGDGNCIYFGKSNWLGKYNNGAMFVNGYPIGKPLPAPVATLLIALGFGAALVMYRNRKQVKA